MIAQKLKSNAKYHADLPPAAVSGPVRDVKGEKRLWPVLGCVLGTLLMLGPVWGLSFSTFNLHRTFGNVSSSGVDPSQKAEVLSRGIEVSQSAVLIGMVAVPIGLALTVFSIWRLARRRVTPTT
jgi:hypothetical protein